MTTAQQTDRKEIAQDLDAAAARAEMIGKTGATAKQCWYLAGLLADRDLTADAVDCGCLNTQAILTKARASKWIDDVIAGIFSVEA